MLVCQADVSLAELHFQLSDVGTAPVPRLSLLIMTDLDRAEWSQVLPGNPVATFSWDTVTWAPCGPRPISPIIVAVNLETWPGIRILVCMRPPSYSDPVALSRGSRRCLIPPAPALFSFLVYSSTPKSGWSMFPDEKSIILLALVLPRLI